MASGERSAPKIGTISFRRINKEALRERLAAWKQRAVQLSPRAAWSPRSARSRSNDSNEAAKIQELLRRMTADYDAFGEMCAGTEWESRDAKKDTLMVVNEAIECMRVKSDRRLSSAWQQRLKQNLDFFVCCVVTLSAITNAVEMDFGPPEGTPLKDRMGWFIVQSIWIFLFTMEIGIKVYLEGYEWWKSAWNWLDVGLVICAIVDVWVLSLVESLGRLHVLAILRIVRLARLIRMVKLVRTLRGLYCILVAMLQAYRKMAHIVFIIFFGMFVYGVFGVVLIGRNDTFKDVKIMGDPVESRWGTVMRSMYSLFELMTLEGWTENCRPLVTKQPLILLFIFSFLGIFSFGLLNMCVGMVVEETLEQTRELKKPSQEQRRGMIADALELTRTTFHYIDRDKDGTISEADLQKSLAESYYIFQFVHDIGGVPYDADVSELYSVFDWTGGSRVGFREFIHGLARIQKTSIFDSIGLHASVRQLEKEVIRLKKRLETLQKEQRRQVECVEKVVELLRNRRAKPASRVHVW